MKRISIITNGPGIAEVKSLYGQASDWVQNVLSDYDVDVKVVKAYEMEDFSSERDDAWIITGSAYSVYDDFKWIDYLKMKLSEMNKIGKPVLGICFGHQLIAEAFGGKVELNSKGWELGSCKIKLTDSGTANKLFSGITTPLSVYQSHQDVVVSLPENATLMAENDMGIQSFVCNDCLYGVQFHPEFTKIVMEKYLEIRYRKGIIKSKPEVKDSEYSYKVIINFIENIIK